MYAQTGSSTNAIVVIDSAHTMRVRVSTRRMPQMPIHRLVRGPAIA